jgi:hypothetical protein
MQRRNENEVIMLTAADADVIWRRMMELMEETWDTFDKRRQVMRTPAPLAKVLPLRTVVDPVASIDEIF